MENPNTWDDITKLINQTIEDWQKAQDCGMIGFSLAQTIKNTLEEYHLLSIP